MRIDAMDAFYLSQLAIAICLGLTNKAAQYFKQLENSPARSVAEAIRSNNETDPVAKSYLRWARGA